MSAPTKPDAVTAAEAKAASAADAAAKAADDARRAKADAEGKRREQRLNAMRAEVKQLDPVVLEREATDSRGAIRAAAIDGGADVMRAYVAHLTAVVRAKTVGSLLRNYAEQTGVELAPEATHQDLRWMSTTFGGTGASHVVEGVGIVGGGGDAHFDLFREIGAGIHEKIDTEAAEIRQRVQLAADADLPAPPAPRPAVCPGDGNRDTCPCLSHHEYRQRRDRDRERQAEAQQRRNAEREQREVPVGYMPDGTEVQLTEEGRWV